MEQFANELRAFNGRRVVVKMMRRELNGLLAPTRTAVADRALATLPRSGGLNVWVAATRVSAVVRTSGRRAKMSVKGSRKSLENKSDMTGVDAGGVRAPSWGKRTRASWHSVVVAPGYFSEPVTDDARLRAGADRALDAALDTIRRG